MTEKDLLKKVGKILEEKYKYPCPNMEVEYIKAVVLATKEAITYNSVSGSLPDDEYIDARASVEAIKYYFANDYNYNKARTIFISGVNWYKKEITPK